MVAVMAFSVMCGVYCAELLDTGGTQGIRRFVPIQDGSGEFYPVKSGRGILHVRSDFEGSKKFYSVESCGQVLYVNPWLCVKRWEKGQEHVYALNVGPCGVFGVDAYLSCFADWEKMSNPQKLIEQKFAMLRKKVPPPGVQATRIYEGLRHALYDKLDHDVSECALCVGGDAPKRCLLVKSSDECRYGPLIDVLTQSGESQECQGLVDIMKQNCRGTAIRSWLMRQDSLWTRVSLRHLESADTHDPSLRYILGAWFLYQFSRLDKENALDPGDARPCCLKSLPEGLTLFYHGHTDLCVVKHAPDKAKIFLKKLRFDT